MAKQSINNKKKKDPQSVLQQFFPVVKKQRVIPEKNFQGFPMPECKYSEELDKHVYCPPCYGSSMRKEEPVDAVWRVCPDCYLSPCVTVEKWDEITDLCAEIMLPDGDADPENLEEQLFKMLDQLDDILVEIFGPRYMRRRPVPECAATLVREYYDGVLQDLSLTPTEDHPDDSFAAAALDVHEFLTQQW